MKAFKGLRKPAILAGYCAVTTGLLVLLLIINMCTHNIHETRLNALEQAIQKSLTDQTATLVAKEIEIATLLQNNLEDRVTEEAAAIVNNIWGVNSGIRQIDTVYSGLLAEQKKKTLDSLYGVTDVEVLSREAAQLFEQGRYTSASSRYEVIARNQPENQEAQFYQLYSLFLANKLDRGNYKQIQGGLLLLEKHGYTRREITEVLEYISREEDTGHNVGG